MNRRSRGTDRDSRTHNWDEAGSHRALGHRLRTPLSDARAADHAGSGPTSRPAAPTGRYTGPDPPSQGVSLGTHLGTFCL
jgi:hypothetical protein